MPLASSGDSRTDIFGAKSAAASMEPIYVTNPLHTPTMPSRSATTLRVVGSLCRFKVDAPVPIRLVEQLHRHIITEWALMVDVLETFKLVTVSGELVYLTQIGAEAVLKLSEPGEVSTKDLDLFVAQATSQPCFARSFDDSNGVCGACPVRVVCQESVPSFQSEVAFQLQHLDAEEHKRLKAEAETKARMARVEDERLKREELRKNAPSLRSLVDRMKRAAEVRDAEAEAPA